MAYSHKAKISVKDCEWLDLFDDIPHKYVKDLDDDDEYELDVFIETKIVCKYNSSKVRGVMAASSPYAVWANNK